MIRRRVVILIAASTLGLAACSGGRSSAHTKTSPAAAHPIAVSSTIHDGDSLSAPTTWTASVANLPPGQHLTGVEFLIDGKKSWNSQFSPYTFNADGYPFWPWLMGLGAHTLTAQATTSGGQSASYTAHVTVTGRPRLLPATVTGTYKRTVTRADVTRTSINEANRVQPGDYAMTVRAGLFVWDGSGFGANEVAVDAGGHTLEFRTTANWLVPDQDIGGFCEAPEPMGRYTWSLSGKTLMLRPAAPDDCANRDSVLTGSWTRAG